MDALLGTELAGYRIDSVIGRGGMGVVYLAEHLRLRRRAALKVLAPELAEDEGFRDRFIRESELAASLEHPNIVPIYDAGEANGLLYLAMRFIDGSDLKTLIRTDPLLELPRVASIVAQVAAALDAAHAAGLVHRDVKSANVLVSPATPSLGEHAFLADFGLTRPRDVARGVTKTGQFVGSVDYAAPEQLQGTPVDARTDVYSLGCVAFECLTGQPPYVGEGEVTVMMGHLREPVPHPTSLRPELPAEVDAVIGRAMAKSADDRYPTAGAFAEAWTAPLQAAARRGGGSLVAERSSPSWGERSSSLVSSSLWSPRSPVASPTRPRRPREREARGSPVGSFASIPPRTRPSPVCRPWARSSWAVGSFGWMEPTGSRRSIQPPTRWWGPSRSTRTGWRSGRARCGRRSCGAASAPSCGIPSSGWIPGPTK
ncbi:MAG TPA: serine/threonine-protein kinase [Actinomycetota bacterium]